MGEWPDSYIDHLDGDPTNNSIDNLRSRSTKNNRNIPQKSSGEHPRFGVKFNGIKKNGYPSYTAWGREFKESGNESYVIITTEELFEALCARISWENYAINQGSGYTLRHFGRE